MALAHDSLRISYNCYSRKYYSLATKKLSDTPAVMVATCLLTHYNTLFHGILLSRWLMKLMMTSWSILLYTILSQINTIFSVAKKAASAFSGEAADPFKEVKEQVRKMKRIFPLQFITLRIIDSCLLWVMVTLTLTLILIMSLSK